MSENTDVRPEVPGHPQASDDAPVVRLSLPARLKAGRSLTDDEHGTLRRIADCLIPASDQFPGAARLDDYDEWLVVALDATAEHLDDLVAVLADLGEVPHAELWDRLRELREMSVPRFSLLSDVVAGTYLMSPTIQRLLGYPGQRRNPVNPEAAAHDLTSGLLDPVIERGPTYVATDA